MKIETVRFKNLNSLYGEWSIDLTDREYVHNGIFLISGPTGSGKSTILDAICLALYGATPRLKVISKTQNDIMSRQSGECFAEVTFRINSKLYRVHWSQHRARRKADGKLAESKHEISDVDTGEILESKKRDVAAFINKITGMDLERFTRSMLLAQGSFAAFLKATADERAPILEQITGTDIYTEISKKVHEMLREETEKLNLLKAESDGIDFLDEEQELLLANELQETQKSSKELEESIKSLNALISWRTELQRVDDEIKRYRKERESLDIELNSFISQRELLNHAENAYKLIGEYKQLEELQISKDKDQKQLVIVESNLKQLVPEKLNHDRRFKEVELRYDNFQIHYSNQVEVISRVRILDHKIGELKRSSKQLQQEITQINRQKEGIVTQRLKLLENLNFLEQESKETAGYLTEFNGDESIRESLSGLTQMDVRLSDLEDEFKGLISDIDSRVKSLEPLELELDRINQDLIKSDIEFNNLREKLIEDKNVIESLLEGRKLTDYKEKLQYKQRERVLVARISSLEEERKTLISGEPCPLCGSREHPWSSGDVDEHNQVDDEIDSLLSLISKVESLVEEYGTKERNLESIRNVITKQTAERDILQNRISSMKGEIETLTVKQRDKKDEFEESRSKFLELLKPYCVKNLKELNQRAEKWELFSKRSSEYQNRKDIIERELEILNVDLQHTEAMYLESEKRYKQLSEESETLIHSRMDQLGEKDVTEYENELQAEKNRLEQELKEFSDRGHKLTELISVTESRVGDIKKRVEEFSHREFSLSELFNLSMGKYGFKSIQEYKSALIPEPKMEILKQERDDLDNRDLMNRDNIHKGEALYKSEKDKNLTKSSLEDLLRDDGEKRERLNRIRQSLGALEERLNRSRTARCKFKEKTREIEDQRKELENWQKLHHLIGSADGKKFRNFAQGLTFERVISSANRELVKMTDRYLLIRDPDAPLELNVIDNYQAGEMRSTKNLSGGEGFIISLSLALGLSRISSRRVKVESLFMDEGFGTLDEEALEQALDTLSHLHQEGKLIGVISHIPVLKERIVTQIQVTKSTGGRGLISGPGCYRGEI